MDVKRKRCKRSLQDLLPPLPPMAGGFVLKSVLCASHRTLGIGNMPITHQSAGDDAWLVMQGQHRTDASGHSSDLLRELDSQVWGLLSWSLCFPFREQFVPSLPGAPGYPWCYRAGREGGARI